MHILTQASIYTTCKQNLKISLNCPKVEVQKASKITVIFNPNSQECPRLLEHPVLLPAPTPGQAQGHNDQRKLLSSGDHQTREGQSTRK